MKPSSHQGIAGKGTPKKLCIAFGLLTSVFVILFLVILPYKFYKRDINDAKYNSQNISKLIRVAVLSHMTEGANPKNMRDLLTMFQTQFEFKFRLIRSSYVEKQHGLDEDPQNKDELINEVFRTGRSREEIWLGSTLFRRVSPFVVDECLKSFSNSKMYAMLPYDRSLKLHCS
jgi:hypothetical protein